MNIEHIIYLSIVIFLIVSFGISIFALYNYFNMLETKYNKEIQELKFKEEKIKNETAQANMEIVKTYERLLTDNKEDSKKQEVKFQSFGEAVTDVFNQITKGEEENE